MDKHFLLLLPLLLGLPQLLGSLGEAFELWSREYFSLGPGAPNSLPNTFIHLLFICVESQNPKARPRVPLKLLYLHKPA